jgi:hypothetical protein
MRLLIQTNFKHLETFHRVMYSLQCRTGQTRAAKSWEPCLTRQSPMQSLCQLTICASLLTRRPLDPEGSCRAGSSICSSLGLSSTTPAIPCSCSICARCCSCCTSESDVASSKLPLACHSSAACRVGLVWGCWPAASCSQRALLRRARAQEGEAGSRCAIHM